MTGRRGFNFAAVMKVSTILPGTPARWTRPHARRSSLPCSFLPRYASVLLILLLGACNEPLFSSGPGAASQDTASEDGAGAEQAALQQPPLYRIQIQFETLRTRVPAGLFSGSDKVWNHIAEEAVGYHAQQLLQRNGMRVGRGRVEDWEPIRALLEAAGPVETSTSNLQVSNGLPLMLELTEPRPEQTLFLIRSDGSSAGATFRDCSDLFRIEYLLDPADPAAVLLDVMPEILAPRPEPPHFALRPTVPEDLVQPSRVLSELAFRIRLGPGEFLAIGPSPMVGDSDHLVGSLLLCDRIEGRRLESMYFITPRVIRTEAGGQP